MILFLTSLSYKSGERKKKIFQLLVFDIVTSYHNHEFQTPSVGTSHAGGFEGIKKNIGYTVLEQ